MSSRQYIYKTADNPVWVTFGKVGIDSPLAAVTRITVELIQDGQTIDSNTPGLISWNTSGRIELDFRTINAAGEQDTKMRAYDPDHPNGQVIAHPESDDMRLTLVFVDG